MPSLLRVIRGVMHFWSFHADSHSTLVGIPNSLAHAYNTWAKARVFYCLTTQKSLRPEASVWNGKSARWSPLNPGGVSHHQGAAWMPPLATGDIEGPQSHWCFSLSGQCPSTPSHWVLVPSTSGDRWFFSISTWMHLWEWLMGSSSSSFGHGQNWDQPADGQGVTLGLASSCMGGTALGP